MMSRTIERDSRIFHLCPLSGMCVESIYIASSMIKMSGTHRRYFYPENSNAWQRRMGMVVGVVGVGVVVGDGP